MTPIDPSELVVEQWPPEPTSGMRVGMSKGVRLTHRPTGLSATCDSERSQHLNRDGALLQLLALLHPHAEPRPVSSVGQAANCPLCGTPDYVHECRNCGYGPRGLGTLPSIEARR